MVSVTQQPVEVIKPSPPSFLWGHLPSFRKNPLQFFQDAVEEGGVVKMRLGPVNVFVVSDPDSIQQALVKHADKFHKSRMLRRALTDILGQGLLTSESDLHRKQRKLIQPAFHHQRVCAYADTMVEYTLAMLNEWESQPSVNIDHEMNFLTMLIVGKTLFDQDNIDQAEAISDAITRRLEMFGEALSRSSILPPLPILNSSRQKMRAETKQIIEDTIDAIIADRRAENTDRGDLLSMLLLSEDEEGNRMSVEQVRHEAITLFLAGHETTANALTWTFYLLAQHPEVEAKLLTEIDFALDGKPPTAEDLPKMPYAAMVIKESMRLYPPAWVFGRIATEDVDLGTFQVKEGEAFIVSPFAMGRSERFHKNPLQFDPERFSPENEAQIPKYAYLPFGGGPRVCIGNGFAMMEAILILTTIVQRFHLSLLTPAEAIYPAPMITMRPKPEVRVKLERRRY